MTAGCRVTAATLTWRPSRLPFPHYRSFRFLLFFQGRKVTWSRHMTHVITLLNATFWLRWAKRYSKFWSPLGPSTHTHTHTHRCTRALARRVSTTHDYNQTCSALEPIHTESVRNLSLEIEFSGNRTESTFLYTWQYAGTVLASSQAFCPVHAASDPATDIQLPK